MTEANFGGKSSRTSARRRRSCTRAIRPRRPTPMALGSIRLARRNRAPKADRPGDFPAAFRQRPGARPFERFNDCGATPEFAFLIRWASSITTTSHERRAPTDGAPRSARTIRNSTGRASRRRPKRPSAGPFSRPRWRPRDRAPKCGFAAAIAQSVRQDRRSARA